MGGHCNQIDGICAGEREDRSCWSLVGDHLRVSNKAFGPQRVGVAFQFAAIVRDSSLGFAPR